MTYIIVAVIVALIVGVVVLYLMKSSKYYKTIFSEEHYSVIFDWLETALKIGPIKNPSENDGSTMQTPQGCGFGLTRKIKDGKDTIHISISEIRGYTTHGVAHRMAFLLLEMLNGNKSHCNLFYTESSIHHIVLQKEETGDWKINDKQEVIAGMNNYKPLPFRLQKLSKEG
ncbi:MAG: hypothetical protein GY757_16660 [bacterium]|nr:hypothetical protein [bacterium]